MSTEHHPTDRGSRTAVPDTADGSEAGARNPAVNRHAVVSREKERYGGMKIGAAFFGWLTATGMAVILTAILAAAGAAVGLSTRTDAGDAAASAAEDPATIGIAGGVALLLVLLVSYYCGGYVAGPYPILPR